MAIGVDQFQILSPEQANPFGYGMQQGSDIASNMMANVLRGIQARYMPQQMQADVLAKQLANQASQAQLPYVGPEAAAQLAVTRAQPGLMGAEAQNYLAEASRAPFENALEQAQTQMMPLTAIGNLDPISKMFASRMIMSRILNGQMSFPGGANNAIQNNPTVNNTPSISDTGNQSQSSQLMNGLQTQPLNNLLGGSSQSVPGSSENYGDLYNTIMKNSILGMTKNPAFGSLRSGEGGTYFDPSSGQWITTPTSKITSLNQQLISSIQRATPQIESLYKNLSPFQTALGEGKLRGEQLSNYVFGTNFDLPSMYAKGNSALNTAPESLVKAFGLNPTNETLAMLQKSIKPITGETGDQYKNRLIEQLSQLRMNQEQAQQQQMGGIPLGNPLSKISNQVPQATNTNKLVRFIGSDGKKYKVTADKFAEIAKEDPNVKRIG